MIYRVQHNKENPYFMLNRAGVNDERLSFKAVGILTYLLSKPDNWTVLEADLVKRHTEGDTAIRSGLKELREFGYLEKVSIRDASTQRITSWETHVRETPQEEVESLIMETETHNVENPPSGNSTLWKTDPLISNDSLESIEDRETSFSTSDGGSHTCEETTKTPFPVPPRPATIDGMTAGELAKKRGKALKYCEDYEPKQHRETFDAIVDAMGKRALVDADNDRTISDLQQATVTLTKAGQTAASIRGKSASWKASYFGQRNGGVQQFIDFMATETPTVTPVQNKSANVVNINTLLENATQ